MRDVAPEGLKVVLAAGESAGARTLQLLAQRGHIVTGVLPASSDPRAEVAGIARDMDLPVFDPQAVRDAGFAEWLADQAVDLFLNVHALHIVHPAVLNAPRVGSFNLHPGPLPGYAGLNAPSWAIYEGEHRHAVTLHWMVEDVDAGDIAYQTWFDVGPRDTGLRVAANCVRHGLPLVGQLLQDAQSSQVPATPQQDGPRRWFGRKAPNDGRLVWADPAWRVEAFVRAATYAPFPSPWGSPRTSVDGRELAVTRARRTGEPAAADPGWVGEVSADGALVAAADEWVRVERLRDHEDREVQVDAVLWPGARLS